MSFPSACLEQLEFGVRLQQALFSPLARLLLGWRNVKAIAGCQSEGFQFYVDVVNYGWNLYNSHQFLLIPTPTVLSANSKLALISR